MGEEYNVTTVAPAPHRSPAAELHATYTSLELLVALTAVIGNAMVIHVFRRDRRLRRRTNYYIVSLAVADLLVGLLGIPFAILASVGLPRNLHACLFTVSILVILCTISIFSLVAVSVDRYWAILYPMCYSRNVRTKTAIVNVLLACGKIHGGPRGRFDPPLNRTNYQHVSAHHTHYSYHPPTRINFICRHCSSVATYPVFHGLPPSYVYKYRESNSRFSELITGLALYNLGRISEYWRHTHYYTRRFDEKCSLQVIDRTRFEETAIPCFLMSSFLPESEMNGPGNPDTFDVTSAHIKVKPLNNTEGPPIFVNREQLCVIWHNTTEKNEKNVIACALLKEYSNTMRPSGIPVYIWLPITVAVVLGTSICCQFCCRKKRGKEGAPLYVKPVVGYTEP